MSNYPTEYLKPLPVIRPETEPFWRAARRHELLIQTCSCGAKIFFPRLLCPHCFSQELKWMRASGFGTVYSFTIIYQSRHPGFKGEPYVYSIVELEEGTRMISNIINIAPEIVRIGMRVRVVFEDVTSEIAIPRFEPVSKGTL